MKDRFREVQSILDNVQVDLFGSPYFFRSEQRCDVILVSAFYREPDIDTGEDARQYTRKWFISDHATESEIVQTALKCVLTSAEHRVRESFTYKGRRCFGPHFNVNALAELAVPAHIDARKERQ